MFRITPSDSVTYTPLVLAAPVPTALAVKVVTVVSRWLPPSPTVMALLRIKPLARISTSVSPAASPSKMLPAVAMTLTLPLVPASTFSNVMLPAVACSLILPGVMAVLCVAESCPMLMALAATMSMVLLSALAVKLAFCKKSRPALTVM